MSPMSAGPAPTADVGIIHQVCSALCSGVFARTHHGWTHDAVVPSIQGRAWITGYVQHVVAPDDPFPEGLTVGDIWSPVPN